MSLSESETREKVAELLDGMDQTRMDYWLLTGIMTGQIDGATFEKVMTEEVLNRSHEVQQYWLGTCNCTGHMN